jgi:hypothetical protein
VRPWGTVSATAWENWALKRAADSSVKPRRFREGLDRRHIGLENGIAAGRLFQGRQVGGENRLARVRRVDLVVLEGEEIPVRRLREFGELDLDGIGDPVTVGVEAGPGSVQDLRARSAIGRMNAWSSDAWSISAMICRCRVIAASIAASAFASVDSSVLTNDGISLTTSACGRWIVFR